MEINYWYIETKGVVVSDNMGIEITFFNFSDAKFFCESFAPREAKFDPLSVTNFLNRYYIFSENKYRLKH